MKKEESCATCGKELFGADGIVKRIAIYIREKWFCTFECYEKRP